MMPTPLKQGSYTRTDGAAAGEGFPRFFLDSVQDELASSRQGRPIFKTVERVEIILPGNQFFRPVFNVTDEYRQMYPKHYEAFLAGMTMAVDGTPIEEWPILQRSQVLELKALEITTIEQVAELSDFAIQRIGMGGRVLRDKARAYLDDACRVAALEESTKQNDLLQSQVAAQDHQIAEMGKLLQALQSQLMSLQNAPSAVQSHIPGAHDPMQNNAPMQIEAAHSSLDALAAPRRGRPPKAAA